MRAVRPSGFVLRGWLATMSAVTGGFEFGPLAVAPSQVVERSARSVVLGDLRPLLPGHVVVAPQRPVARYGDLSAEEAVDLFATARAARVSAAAACGDGGAVTAFNVALKDGAAAGQPVAHAHVHVVPRVRGDLETNDDIYGMLDAWTPDEAAAPASAAATMDVPDDSARAPRSAEQMAEEAAAYAATAASLAPGFAGPGGVAVRSGPLPTSDVFFGKFALDPRQVFYVSASGLTRAFVNLKPLVPGHVLVVPTKRVARLEDLDDAEHADLWRTTREVHAVVVRHYGAAGANVAVQDGADAGQSVPHVHVHVLPRAG